MSAFTGMFKIVTRADGCNEHPHDIGTIGL